MYEQSKNHIEEPILTISTALNHHIDKGEIETNEQSVQFAADILSDTLQKWIATKPVSESGKDYFCYQYLLGLAAHAVVHVTLLKRHNEN